jgi:cold shock CspA family protein
MSPPRLRVSDILHDDRGRVQDYNGVDYGLSPDFSYKWIAMTEIKKVVGKIIKVSKAGWGFISSKDIEFTRIFFHWTALRQDTIPFLELKTGMMVEFTPLKIEGKGHRAVHVRVIDKPAKEEKSNEGGVPEAEVYPLQK